MFPTPQASTWARAGEFSVANNEAAVNDDLRDACRMSVRRREGRAVVDRLGIEHDDVGGGSCTQQPAIAEPERRRW